MRWFVEDRSALIAFPAAACHPWTVRRPCETGPLNEPMKLSVLAFLTGRSLCLNARLDSLSIGTIARWLITPQLMGRSARQQQSIRS